MGPNNNGSPVPRVSAPSAPQPLPGLAAPSTQDSKPDKNHFKDFVVLKRCRIATKRRFKATLFQFELCELSALNVDNAQEDLLSYDSYLLSVKVDLDDSF